MWRTGLLAPSVPLAHNMFRIVKGNPNCKIFCRHNARNAVSVTAWKIKVWVHAYLASKLSIWSSREKSRECLVQAVHLSLDMLWSRWWFIHPNSGFFFAWSRNTAANWMEDNNIVAVSFCRKKMPCWRKWSLQVRRLRRCKNRMFGFYSSYEKKTTPTWNSCPR